MAIYYINYYDIDNMEAFKKYPPKVRPLLVKFDAEVLSLDTKAFVVAATVQTVNTIFKFPDLAPAMACDNYPQYA